MNEQYRFRIDTPPRVKQRPRMTRRGRVYTPQQTHDYEKAVAAFYDGPMFDGPVSLTICMYDTHSTVTIRQVEKPKRYIRGDLDNLVKAIADGLNGAAYKDDRQVVRLNARKM